MPKLSERLDDIVLVRSMEAWETVHSRGQYYLQTGHAVSPARIKETPSMGAVIAYETMARRKTGDFLPPFVAMNYVASGQYGPLEREGCLASECSPLTLDLRGQSLPFFVEDADRARLSRRWELLRQLDPARAGSDPTIQKPILEFASFAKSAHRMMGNPAVHEILQLGDAEKKKYGSSPIGDACLLARNMVAAEAGVRFFLLTHGDWDHQRDIYREDGKRGIYKLCEELDSALSALLIDLQRMRAKDGRSLLDKTFVVCMGEFGRAPGDLTVNQGREHYAKAMVGAFAGAGVQGGRVIGATDPEASRVVKSGWRQRRPIFTEDVCATVYSVLGIDWSKRITNTPSGREFVYVDPAAGTSVIDFQEITDLFQS